MNNLTIQEMKTKSLCVIPIFVVLLLCVTPTVWGAIRTASVSGNWSSTTTWGGASVPTSSDAVTINSGITVTVDMAAQCLSLTFAAVTTSSAVTISGSNSLAITNALTMPRPSTGQTCTTNVNAGTFSCGTLTMSATTTARPDILNITTGTATISGALTLGGAGCQFNLTGTGTFNMGGAYSSTPTMSTVAGSTVNYTGSGAQNVYPITYQGNLGLSGTGTKTIPNIYTSNTLVVLGNLTNSSTLVLAVGTSTVPTYLIMGGNVTNNPGATITATDDYTEFYFYGTTAQMFTNNGTVTAPVFSFTLENAAGLTLLGTGQTVCSRVNLFYGTITNSNRITLGNGGTSYAVVQRGVTANTLPVGTFDAGPTFNLGTGGYFLLYDDGSAAFSTGYEVPSTLTADYFYIFDAADVSLNSDLTVSTELNFYGGTGTPALRIGTHTLTIGETITYTVPGSFNGGTGSNLVLNGSTDLNAITGGLNNLTINATTTLGGALTVNGTLTLANGWLINGSNLTMASGTTISRSAGNVLSAPTFAGTVSLVYSGGTALSTGKEMPASPSVLINLTTNAGGVRQNSFTTSTTNVLTDAFPNLTSWTGNKGTTAGNFNSVASAVAGGTSPEVEFIGSNTHGVIPYYIYRGPISTTGYSLVNVSFKTATSGYYTPNVTSYLKLQSSTSASGPWHDIWSYTYTGELPASTISIPCYSTDVGGNMYFQFAFQGDYYVLDYWYFDDLVVDGITFTPIASTLKVNGNLDLANGPYTIGSTGQLTVSGNTHLNGTDCLILKSDATGSASFIDNGFTGTGTARVERYLTTNTWHYLSSPISNALAGIFLNDYLKTSDPSTASGWGPWITPVSNPLQVMRGYACWKPNTNSSFETFSGNLNTGSQSISLNRNASNPWAGWHLVGNPYPSDINLASAGVTWNNFEPTAYFWNGSVYLAYPTTGGYGTHSQYVPQEQGFFAHIVNTYSGSTNLSMTNTARVHNGETFLKEDAPVFKNALLVTVEGTANTYFDKVSVHFNPDATSGYDPGYDAYKLEGIAEAPSLYTKIEDTKVSCNSLPFEKKNMVVPMGFSCGIPGIYTIIAENLGSFEDVISIHLEDLKLSVTRDLRTNPVYNFTYDTLDDPNRFVLHFDDPNLGVSEPKNLRPVQIYSYGNAIYVQSSDGTPGNGTVFVYDLMGKELYSNTLSNQALSRIVPGVMEGYYLVRVVTGEGSYNGKVYLR